MKKLRMRTRLIILFIVLWVQLFFLKHVSKQNADWQYLVQKYNNLFNIKLKKLQNNENTNIKPIKNLHAKMKNCIAERNSVMATFKLNDKIKFILPSGFIFSKEKDDGHNESGNITFGEYEDEDGEVSYELMCLVSCTRFNPADLDNEFTKDNFLELLAKRMEDSRYMKLSGAPKTILLNKGNPMSMLGIVMKVNTFIAFVQVEDWTVLQLISTDVHSDDNPDINSERYKNIFEVLKATRIKGKTLPLEGLTPSNIQNILQLTFEESGESIDVSSKFQANGTSWNDAKASEYTTEGVKEVEERLTRVTPNIELYPHYNNMRTGGVVGYFGGNVPEDTSGAEYEFIALLKGADSDEFADEVMPLVERIVAKDTENYVLHDKAKEMRKLFRVNESAFNPQQDRECELEEGLMKKAYMMSGLRSFAWTLADYCKQQDCIPEEIDRTVPSVIANYVANADWLNYDGKTYCQGLCSGSDVNVYFVPDGITKNDRNRLLPSKEARDFHKKMKENFPLYNEILSEVHSLNALRKDLKYIYPAVEVLWDNLKEERDYDRPLLGNEADIVYAWCALALAAKEPFFTENGPTSYYYSQIKDEEEQSVKWKIEEKECADSNTTEEWMSKYGKYIEINPAIDFNGLKFVFSGLAAPGDIKDHPIVQNVIEKGGQYRSKVSGLTNYLVVDPRHAGKSKIIPAIEELEKGKNIRIILLEDLEKALEEKNYIKKSSASTSKPTMRSKTSSTEKKQNQSLGRKTQVRSDEERQKLNEAIEGFHRVENDLQESQTAIDKFSDYLELQDAREKALEEEKARKKSEAMARGKSDKDIVSMYVILTNEKKLGMQHRSQDDFYKSYEDLFPGFTKEEIIMAQKNMLAAMEDEAHCRNYAESFRQRSVKDRFTVSALNLMDKKMDLEYDITKCSEFAIENSKEWFKPEELSEVRKLMDDEIADMRRGIDEQFKMVEEKWMKFATSTEFLKLAIAKKKPDGSDIKENTRTFQLTIDSNVISIKLSTKGIIKLVQEVNDYIPWYWGVTVRDIWEAAYKNEIRDEREGAHDGDQIAARAINQIRTKYSGNNASSAAIDSSYIRIATTLPDSKSSNGQVQQSKKQEGCYIATAVYGSYEAPQVMLLRRYRDETLRKTSLGRWFIRTYYRFSPSIAKKLKKAKHINNFVRAILDIWLIKIKKQQL